MKNNKTKVLVFFAIIIIAVIGVILAIVFGKKEEVSPSGNVNVLATLEGNNQLDIDKEIKQDLEEKKYGLSDAKVYVNPYGSTPLSALLAFKTDKETDVKITIKGKHDDDITLTGPKETYHYVPIYGLYANYDNRVEVELGTGEKEVFTITTGGIEGMPKATINNSDVEKGSTMYFFTSPLAMTSFAIDAAGEVRWLIDEMYYHSVTELENGHLLIGTSDTNSSGLGTRIIEIDYLGRLYNEYEIEEGYLNDFYVKEDGNIIVASKNKDRKTFSDYIIEIDRKTGKIVKTWDIYKALEKIDPVFVNNINRDDFFYNSGIEYYSNDDSLLLTYWGGEFVVNMSYEKGTVEWIFGNPEYFTSAFSSVLLKGDEGFVYPKSMHSAKLVGDVLKVFDNGYSTNKNDANSKNLVGSHSSANTYKIDGKNITLTNTIDLDKKMFSYALGDYKLYSSTNELVLFGRELRDLNYSLGIDINEYDETVSRVIELDGDKTVLDMEVDWGTLTVDKINFDGCEFNFDLPEGHTTLEPSLKEDITDDILRAISNCETSVPYLFGYSKKMIEHNVSFLSEDEAKLVLMDENKNGAVYTLKVKSEPAVKKIVTDLSKGKYYIYILENGNMYKTDKFIEID